MALIAADALANALCLLMMLRLTGQRILMGRTLTAAVMGTIAARLLQMSGMDSVKMVLCALPVAVLMTGLACGRWRLRDTLALLAACGLLGGVVTSLWGATGSLQAAWGIGVGAVSLMAAGMLRTQRALGDIHKVRVTIRLGERAATFDAMADSGNCLRDYLTHRPVIVLPEEPARKALQLDGTPLRPIFADTAGGRQMMSCFMPKQTMVEAEGRQWIVMACVALSPVLAAHTPALVPQSLLMQEIDEKYEGAIEAKKEGDAYGKAES